MKINFHEKIENMRRNHHENVTAAEAAPAASIYTDLQMNQIKWATHTHIRMNMNTNARTHGAHLKSWSTPITYV